MTKSPEFVAWANMKDRCFNANNKSYRRYGGRGITVCPRWLDSFENFLADMGPRASSALSIERIDNDGNYEKDNCMWATRSQQQQNRAPFKHAQGGG